MSVIAITGVAGYLGSRLLSLLEHDPEVRAILGIDTEYPSAGSPKLELFQMDVRDSGLARVIAGADAVVHLAFQHDPGPDEAAMRSANVEGTRNVLEAAAAAGVRRFVYASSTTVYGAHADNPVPLTEKAPLRPNPGFSYAAQKRDAEALIGTFRDSHPDLLATIIRSAIAFGPGVENFVSRMLEAPRLFSVKGYDPPLQFVHEDDVAAALAFALRHDLDGVYNVAADGWVTMREVEQITGKKRLDLPEAIAFSMADRLWRLGVSSEPPDELHYLMHPWVVDNAKLKRAGWTPERSNREALAEAVAAHTSWIALGRARVRKGSLARGAAATLGAVGAMAVVRRAKRRGR